MGKNKVYISFTASVWKSIQSELIDPTMWNSQRPSFPHVHSVSMNKGKKIDFG